VKSLPIPGDSCLHSYTFTSPHLDGDGAEHDGAEDGVSEDALEHVALPVNLAGVDLVEDLHHDEGVEDDGVVFGRRGVEGGEAPVVDVEDPLACRCAGGTTNGSANWFTTKVIHLQRTGAWLVRADRSSHAPHIS